MLSENRLPDAPQRKGDKIKDSAETTGVHADQATFISKLKLIKRLMLKCKVIYQGAEMNLWDFAALEDKMH